MPYHSCIFLTGPRLKQGPYSNPKSLSPIGVSLTNMDIHSLDDALQGCYSAALATSTHKTYWAAEFCRIAFCEKFGVRPLPSNENNLRYFVTWLEQEGLQHFTICT